MPSLCHKPNHRSREFVVYWRHLRMRKLGIATFLIGAGLAVGQTISGSITGVITDTSGVAVEAATVQATTNPPTGTHRAVSDKTGKYNLAGLPPGTYDLQVVAGAMQTFTKKAVEVK